MVDRDIQREKGTQREANNRHWHITRARLFLIRRTPYGIDEPVL